MISTSAAFQRTALTCLCEAQTCLWRLPALRCGVPWPLSRHREPRTAVHWYEVPLAPSTSQSRRRCARPGTRRGQFIVFTLQGGCSHTSLRRPAAGVAYDLESSLQPRTQVPNTISTHSTRMSITDVLTGSLRTHDGACIEDSAARLFIQTHCMHLAARWRRLWSTRETR